MSMKRKVAAVLAAVSLMTVASGALADWGDADKDKGETPRYQIGQEVEVYNSGFHYTTIRKKITGVEKYNRAIFSDDYVWRYHVEPVKKTCGEEEWVNANAIESSKT